MIQERTRQGTLESSMANLGVAKVRAKPMSCLKSDQNMALANLKTLEEDNVLRDFETAKRRPGSSVIYWRHYSHSRN